MEDHHDLNKLIKECFPKLTVYEIFNPSKFLWIESLVLAITLFLGVVIFIQIERKDKWELKLYNPSLDVSPYESVKSAEAPEITKVIGAVNSRKLFQETKKELPPPPKIVPKGPNIKQKMKALVLVGIIDDEPMQAIIESKTTKETYYVKKGDPILDMEVLDVSQGQVKLKYNEETDVLR